MNISECEGVKKDCVTIFIIINVYFPFRVRQLAQINNRKRFKILHFICLIIKGIFLKAFLNILIHKPLILAKTLLFGSLLEKTYKINFQL